MCMRLFPEGYPIAKEFEPLSHTQVIEFIIVPHIATNLIAQASKTSHAAAHLEMMTSADYGDKFHHDLDNPMLYAIHKENIRLFRNIEIAEEVQSLLDFLPFSVSYSTDNDFPTAQSRKTETS